MQTRERIETILVIALAALLGAPVGLAQADDRASLEQPEASDPPADPEDCLSCHRFPGLARLDDETGELRLFFTSARHYARMEGPHSRLPCTGCHERSQVETIPHEAVEPVSCTQECHLVTASGGAITFSHDALSERLETSVHTAEAFGELDFGRPLLREGQSTCLYCHDQPVFREPDMLASSHRGVDVGARCATCHTEELAVDADYYVRHTTSRLQSARPMRESAQVCAVCHGDPDLNEQMGLHDAVASYFKSFHGKAGLLGKGETAVCVDCHATETGDAHLMMDAEAENSPLHPDNLATTCRTVGCHPSAAPRMGAASVHLDIDPDKKSVEYWLTAAFIALNVGVLAQYFLLVIMELLSIVLRRQSAHHRKMVALAKTLQAHPEGAERLSRMTVHQRFQHWIFVLMFILLVLTGMPLKFAATPSMQWLVAVFGGVNTARVLHRAAGIVLIASFTWHLAYLGVLWLRAIEAKREMEPGRGFLKTALLVAWTSPMMLRPQDIKDFTHLFLHLFGFKKDRPLHGRYHFTQKAEYWALFWGMATIGISGALLWTAGWSSGLLGGRALNFAIIVHTYEAFLAFLSVSVLHLFAVVFSPAVFPLSRASLSGVMPPEETAEAHEGHLMQVAQDLGIDVPTPAAPSGFRHLLRQLIRRTYAACLLVAVCLLCFVSLTWLAKQWFGVGPAPDEVRDVALRIDMSDLEGAERQSRHERGPLAHFHVIPAWYSEDVANGCTASGCHQVLPHGERKEDRAFLNMHTTFVDCQVCHLEVAPTPGELGWVTLEDRSGREAPAVLQLAALLEPAVPSEAEGRLILDRELRRLLTVAIDESGGDPELELWALQLDTAHPDGELYASYLREIRQGLGLHGHGEYGAKLGIPGRRFTLDAEGERAAESLRGGGADLAKDEKEPLVEVVHRGFVRPDVQCTRCHADESDLVDFEQLGYSPRHADSLRGNAIVRQSESVERGETFYLPGLLTPTLPEEQDDDSGAEPAEAP